MSHQQILAFALILATLVMFVWGRFRYDLVALGALLAGVLLGVIPAKHAFDGFKNDVVVIIATALVVSAAFARSGLVEVVLRPLLNRLSSERTQSPVLTAATAVLSMATKNVGALAILMPVALQLTRRTGTAPSRLLMPMSFASLFGGLVTLVGTSPNIIVSDVRDRMLGHPFAMYDFAPVGLSLAAIGVAFLAVAYRLLPAERPSRVALSEVLASSQYVTEAEAPEGWTARRVADLKARAGSDVKITSLIRKGMRLSDPHPNTFVRAGDAIVLEGGEDALHHLMADLKLKPTRHEHRIEKASRRAEIRSIEAVIGPDSSLIGAIARRLDLQDRWKIKLLAVSRSGRRTLNRLQAAALKAGDILLLRGDETALPGALSELGLLPLAERTVQLGARRPLYFPAIVLAAAMILVAFKVLPIAIAFFAAAVALIAFRAIPMREAYGALDGPVLVLIAALIPVSEALQATGGVDLLARTFADAFSGAAPQLVLAVLMTTSMLSAPFLHNAPTVLILAPVAVGVAHRLGLHPDALLMGVAVGAACDFLTPVGHQCNTLVMGPGGYRFSDYPRLGAPLSVVVILAGTALIGFFWPLTG